MVKHHAGLDSMCDNQSTHIIADQTAFLSIHACSITYQFLDIGLHNQSSNEQKQHDMIVFNASKILCSQK